MLNYSELGNVFNSNGVCSNCDLTGQISKYYFSEQQCQAGYAGIDKKKTFQYLPNNFSNPCKGGGQITTHYIDNNNNIILDKQITIPASINHQQIQYRPTFEFHAECEKGFGCIFDPEYIYNINMPSPILVGHCDLINLYDEYSSDNAPYEENCPDFDYSVDKEGKYINFTVTADFDQSIPIVITRPNGTEYIDQIDINNGENNFKFKYFEEGIYHFQCIFTLQFSHETCTENQNVDTNNDHCPTNISVVEPEINEIKIICNAKQYTNCTFSILDENGQLVEGPFPTSFNPGLNELSYTDLENLREGLTYFLLVNYIGVDCNRDKIKFIIPSENDNIECPTIKFDRFTFNTYSLNIYSTSDIENVLVKITSSNNNFLLKKINIQNGDLSYNIDLNGLIAGEYKIEIIFPNKCPRVSSTFFKNSIIDEPSDECMERTVICVNYSSIDSSYYLVSKIFVDSIYYYYNVSYLDIASETTISTFNFQLNDITVENVIIDSLHNLIIIGVKNDSTYVKVISQNRTLIWEKWILGIYESHRVLRTYPFQLVCLNPISNQFIEYTIDIYGNVVSAGPVLFSGLKGGSTERLENIFLQKNTEKLFTLNTIPSRIYFNDNVNGKNDSLDLDSNLIIKNLIRYETGQYLICGEADSIVTIADSTYSLDYNSIVFILLDSLYSVERTEIVSDLTNIYLTSSISYEPSFILYSFLSSDTIYQGLNQDFEIENCEQIGFLSLPANRIKYKSNSVDTAFNTSLIETKFEVKIYPNPGCNFYTIDLFSNRETNVQLEIYDILGKTIFQDSLPLANGDNRYIISNEINFENGIYILNFKDSLGKNISTQKVVNMCE